MLKPAVALSRRRVMEATVSSDIITCRTRLRPAARAAHLKTPATRGSRACLFAQSLFGAAA